MKKVASYKLVYNRKGEDLKPTDERVVQIEVYYNRKRKYISTGMKLTKDQWKDGKVVKDKNAIQKNIDLQNRLNQLRKIELEITNKGEKFSPDALDDKYIEQKNFLDFLEMKIKERTDIRHSTKKHHWVLLNKLKDFGKIKFFNDLTYENIQKFDNWLFESGVGKTTKFNQHKILKPYVKMGTKLGYLKFEENPYNLFKAERGKNTDIKYLTPEELEAVINVEIPSSSKLARVRDLFLFSCYTGLSYMDAFKLTPEDILEENGEQYIRPNRIKTDVKATIFLLPEAKAIIEKYRGIKKGKLLPYLSNQKMNDYLKIIATKAEIKKELTTHMARHTFATTTTLLKGVSLEVVSKMLGHTSIKTTQVYAKVVDERVKDEMIQLRSKNEMSTLAKKKENEKDKDKNGDAK